jgi:hypothetical protein
MVLRFTYQNILLFMSGIAAVLHPSKVQLQQGTGNVVTFCQSADQHLHRAVLQPDVQRLKLAILTAPFSPGQVFSHCQSNDRSAMLAMLAELCGASLQPEEETNQVGSPAAGLGNKRTGV